MRSVSEAARNRSQYRISRYDGPRRPLRVGVTPRVGIGVVGAGRMGSIHARLIARSVPEVRLVGIADVNLEAARRLAGELGDPAVFGSLDDLLAAPQLDAVLIAISSSEHLEAVRSAARAGKDILCEKPIALTMADTVAAIAAAEAATVRLQVGFMRRWDPDYARARARLVSGALGRPILFKSLQFDAEPPPVSFADPAVSGGIMVDMGIHEFDLARWLMDDEVGEVHAYGSSVAHPALATAGDVDSAVVNLRFAEVLATAGSIWVGHLPVSQGAWSGADALGALALDTVDPSRPRFEVAYTTQTRGFAQAILEDRPVDVPGSAGTAALAIALAADRSMREGHPVAL